MPLQSGGSLKTGLLPNPVQTSPASATTTALTGGSTSVSATQSSANKTGSLTNPMMQNLLAQNPQGAFLFVCPHLMYSRCFCAICTVCPHYNTCLIMARQIYQ